ncbi:NAC domain superfamily [Abeliophyllum distichum]|uniref:NAC domain superfamily n=1 Tax=Abeliophyllum distichum TaxID=126358 RepID=A0ABD1TIV8_9LAMI
MGQPLPELWRVLQQVLEQFNMPHAPQHTHPPILGYLVIPIHPPPPPAENIEGIPPPPPPQPQPQTTEGNSPPQPQQNAEENPPLQSQHQPQLQSQNVEGNPQPQPQNTEGIPQPQNAEETPHLSPVVISRSLGVDEWWLHAPQLQNAEGIPQPQNTPPLEISPGVEMDEFWLHVPQHQNAEGNPPLQLHPQNAEGIPPSPPFVIPADVEEQGMGIGHVNQVELLDMSDSSLVVDILRPKIFNLELHANVGEVDICSQTPEHLAVHFGGDHFLCLSPIKRWGTNKPVRTVKIQGRTVGSWKLHRGDEEIYNDQVLVGIKHHLTWNPILPINASIWRMHQYILIDAQQPQPQPHLLHEWVLMKIYRQPQN